MYADVHWLSASDSEQHAVSVFKYHAGARWCMLVCARPLGKGPSLSLPQASLSYITVFCVVLSRCLCALLATQMVQ